MTEPQQENFVLSVVLGTCNRLSLLKQCIESIIAETSVPTCIFVTDAGSTDGTIAYLRGIASDRISTIFLGEKVGQARAYNEVFGKVTTPYVCWLSDDNVIVNGGLDTGVRVLEENPSVGMVGLKVKDVEGPFASEAYVGGVSEIGILNVNQGLLRTHLLKRLGGFSEEFGDYGIDPDLTARVLFSGHSIVYTKKIAIHHYRDWGQAEALAAQMEKQKRYKALYMDKYGDMAPRGKLWRLRRLSGFGIRKIGMKLAKRIDSRYIAHLSRDWFNILISRYIGIFDHLRHLGKDFHLYQSADRARGQEGR
jgi:GT2 family glycosyltransferase